VFAVYRLYGVEWQDDSEHLICKKVVVAPERQYLGTCPEELRKIKKITVVSTEI
jgi:hypothetical protein